MQETYDVDVQWLGFQLHPEIPPGGVALRDYFGERRAAAMAARVESFAAEIGVPLNAPAHAPSTVAPLAASEYARDRDALEPMRDRLMDAYWVDGRDIEAPEVIAECAAAVGLDGSEAASAASDPAYISRVEAAREQAHDANVSAIPTLLVGGFPIVGCQRWEVYEMVADKLSLPRAKPRPPTPS